LEGARLGLVLANRWIARGDVLLVLVATCWERVPGLPVARCVLVGGPSDSSAVDPATEAVWLSTWDAESPTRSVNE